MLYKALSAAVYGIDASVIEVEVASPASRPMKITFILSDYPMLRCEKAATGCAPL